MVPRVSQSQQPNGTRRGLGPAGLEDRIPAGDPMVGLEKGISTPIFGLCLRRSVESLSCVSAETAPHSCSRSRIRPGAGLSFSSARWVSAITPPRRMGLPAVSLSSPAICPSFLALCQSQARESWGARRIAPLQGCSTRKPC